ncbi:MAG: hypothetical protein MUO22_03200 [Sedimentisphaerales bacterium]|nr:hypothetical protein [Sedimentisphaerales bacterium]
MKPVEGSSEKQSHDNSEYFSTLLQHQLGANMVRENGNDPELAQITTVWPELPGHIKAAIKALIKIEYVQR